MTTKKPKRVGEEHPGNSVMAIDEFGKVVEAGDKLAEAAHHIQAHHDGVHRLRLALSDWYKVRADEFGRGKVKP